MVSSQSPSFSSAVSFSCRSLWRICAAATQASLSLLAICPFVFHIRPTVSHYSRVLAIILYTVSLSKAHKAWTLSECACMFSRIYDYYQEHVPASGGCSMQNTQEIYIHNYAIYYVGLHMYGSVIWAEWHEFAVGMCHLLREATEECAMLSKNDWNTHCKDVSHLCSKVMKWPSNFEQFRFWVAVVFIHNGSWNEHIQSVRRCSRSWYLVLQIPYRGGTLGYCCCGSQGRRNARVQLKHSIPPHTHTHTSTHVCADTNTHVHHASTTCMHK